MEVIPLLDRYGLYAFNNIFFPPYIDSITTYTVSTLSGIDAAAKVMAFAACADA